MRGDTLHTVATGLPPTTLLLCLLGLLLLALPPPPAAASAAAALSFMLAPPAPHGSSSSSPSPSSSSSSSPSPSPSSGGSGAGAVEGRVVRVPLENFKNSMYHGQMAVGTPPQHFRVMFATGSADSWLPSKLCVDAPCRAHARFAESYSSSFHGSTHAARDAADRFNLTYSLGSMTVLRGKDAVALGEPASSGAGSASASGSARSGESGGGGGGGLRLPEAAFGRVVQQDAKFQKQYKWLPFDGIVGLGYAGASVSRQQPLFDALMQSGQLRRNMFSLYLSQSEDKAGSVLVLGGTDPKLHLDEVQFFPVEKDPGAPHVFWMLGVSRIALVESEAATSSPLDRRVLTTLCAPEQHHRGCRAVVDSGTSLISGPSAAIRELREQIRVDPACGNLETLPLLQFQFHGKTFSLDPADYVVRVPVGDSHACFLGVEEQDFPEQMGPMWVLGNVFLRKYYSVFDRDRDLVGFARARPA